MHADHRLRWPTFARRSTACWAKPAEESGPDGDGRKSQDPYGVSQNRQRRIFRRRDGGAGLLGKARIFEGALVRTNVGDERRSGRPRVNRINIDSETSSNGCEESLQPLLEARIVLLLLRSDPRGTLVSRLGGHILHWGVSEFFGGERLLRGLGDDVSDVGEREVVLLSIRRDRPSPHCRPQLRQDNRNHLRRDWFGGIPSSAGSRLGVSPRKPHRSFEPPPRNSSGGPRK